MPRFQRGTTLGFTLAGMLCLAMAAGLRTPAVAAQQQAVDTLQQGWASLSRGDVETAAGIAATLLAADAGGAIAVDATRVENARLLQAACLYTEGRTREALAAIEAVEDPVAVAAGVEDEHLPPGFGLWVAAVATGNLGDEAQPRVSLSELNPDREVHEVASHFSMDVEIVRIPVIVEDTAGDFVTGLEAADFEVVDGEPPAQPVYQIISEDEPSSIGILLDASDAARDKVPVMLQATLQLLGQLRPDDEAFLLQFGGEPRFLSDFAAGGQDLLPAVARYQPEGGRVLHDAIATGLIRMREAGHDKKSLVLIAAGEDDGSRVAATEVRRAAQREGVSIHVLLLPAGLPRWRPGQDDDQPTFLLQRLAHETGGLVALRPALEDRFGGLSGWIDRAAVDIGNYIKHQYLLQFESGNPPPPGEWRQLRVRVHQPHERVRARSGYVR